MALKGIKVIEMGGLAPAPYCGMVLSDFGASVIKVDKVRELLNLDRLCRGKRSIAVNLKQPEGINVVKTMCRDADVLIEPYRPGVMEKLGLGPQVLMKDNPRLIYARLTGYGQSGPLWKQAGHDINYLAISGVLSMLGRKHEKPYAPLNLLADFAGGGLICAFGIVTALLERERSGLGQVIDTSMTEGAAYVSTFRWKTDETYIWGNERGENWLDGAAHFYDTYKTRDGKYMAVGAIEPQFYQLLLQGLGLENADDAPTQAPEDFETGRAKFAEIFAQKTQDEWCKIFDHVDACVTPVVDHRSAPHYPQNASRGSFIDRSEPAAAPRLLRTPAVVQTRLPAPGEHTKQVLRELGYTTTQIQRLIELDAVEASDLQSKL